MKRIVCIGGGTGISAVLKALRGKARLSAIISMADDGGSAGVLRQQNILPPNDLRKAISALSANPGLAEKFETRIPNGPYAGFAHGTMVIVGIEKKKGLEEAIRKVSLDMDVRGDVIPVTFDNVQLLAELEDGEIIKGETNIDVPKSDRAPIKRVWIELYPPIQGRAEAKANPRAITAISNADTIIIGPGDLYTSVIPNFLVHGVADAVNQSKAKKVYLCNLMTKHGETDGYAAEDFVKAIERFVPIDVAVFNDKKPSAKLLAKYRDAKSEFVATPKKVSDTLLLADVLAEDGFIRHDSGNKLADVILGI